MRGAVSVGSKTMYNKRVPEHGDWSTGSNVVNVNHRIPVELNPAPNERVRLTVDVWEADEGGDDHLGKWTHDLSAATGCGLRENGGIFRSGDFSRISSITAAHQPIVDVNQLSATDMFWGIKNVGTPSLSHATYAAAFWDVDYESDWWDGVPDVAFNAIVLPPPMNGPDATDWRARVRISGTGWACWPGDAARRGGGARRRSGRS
jgi:hypothetical protein